MAHTCSNDDVVLVGVLSSLSARSKIDLSLVASIGLTDVFLSCADQLDKVAFFLRADLWLLNRSWENDQNRHRIFSSRHEERELVGRVAHSLSSGDGCGDYDDYDCNRGPVFADCDVGCPNDVN